MDAADTFHSCILCKSSLAERAAYLLPCVHSVCDKCIKNNGGDQACIGDGGKSPVSVVNLADEINCPDCKEKFQFADLVDNLLTRRPSDVPIIIEEVEKHACTGCDESVEATSHCKDCNEHLCDQCVFAHRRVKITKDHVISPLNNGNKDGIPNESATYCKQHRNEKLSFFCEVCDILTCRNCQLLEHKEHRYQFLPEAARIYKEQTEKFAQHLQSKKETLKLSASKIQEKLAYVKSQKDVVRDEVQSQARKLVEQVIEYAKQILQNLNFVCDAAGKRLAQEGADASAMLQKIEHMASFLKYLKTEPNDLSLLYTKRLILKQAANLAQANLELFSLKGQLNLEYRHDAPFFFQNISKLGTIFVNGLRYPPNKNQPGSAPIQQQHPLPTTNAANSGSNISEQQRKLMVFAMQRAALNRNQQQTQQQQLHQQQQQQQQQNFQSRISANLQGQRPLTQQAQTNMVRSNHHNATGNIAFANWQNGTSHQRGQQQAQHLQPGSSARLMNHELLIQQQQQQATRVHHHQPSQQQFQPMKLNTRPVTSNVSSHQQMNMNWNGNRSSDNSQRTSEVDNGQRRQSMSPSKRCKTETADDDFYDCIITAAKIKGQKLEDNAGLILGDESNTINLIDDVEAENALTDVLKNMPIELTESKSNPSSPPPTTTRTTTEPKEPNNQEQPTTTHEPQEKPTETIPETPKDVPTEVPEEQSAPAEEKTESQQEDKASNESSQSDPNEDYCACCHNGGDVLCCERCPRVYHLQCHIPPLPCVPPGVFVCLLCEDPVTVSTEDLEDSSTPGSKRKAPSGLTDEQLKVCEKILLELFCHQQSVAFHEPVGRNVLNYHKIITKPQDFTNIKCKLSRQHFNHYNSVYDFLSDVRQVFLNCAMYNAPTSEVGKSGIAVRNFFEDLVKKNLSGCLRFVQSEPTKTPPPLESNGSMSPKRQRVDGGHSPLASR